MPSVHTAQVCLQLTLPQVWGQRSLYIWKVGAEWARWKINGARGTLTRRQVTATRSSASLPLELGRSPLELDGLLLRCRLRLGSGLLRSGHQAGRLLVGNVRRLGGIFLYSLQRGR